MKNKLLFIFISLFILLIGLNKVNAYTIYDGNGFTIDDNYVLNSFKNTFSNFDENTFEYLFCSRNTSSNSIECNYFNSLNQLRGNDSSYLIESSLYRINFNSSGSITSSLDYSNRTITCGFFFIKDGRVSYTNFDVPNSSYNEQVNVLFKSEPEPEEPVEEQMSILTISTENLSKILDKATDICEYFFTQELFLMCLSVILFYFSFLIIYRFIR